MFNGNGKIIALENYAADLDDYDDEEEMEEEEMEEVKKQLLSDNYYTLKV